MPSIESHASVSGEALRRGAIQSLQANRIEPKYLYVTPQQTGLWRAVFRTHSPIHGNPEFVRIYQEAFSQIAGEMEPGKILLVGLGCGTGVKEAELCSRLKAKGHEVQFTGIDVSRSMVEESTRTLIDAGAENRKSLVCDLAETDFIGEWLNQLESKLPRVITFFGLVPNFAPSAIGRLFRAVLRPGDVLLASAHLVPAETGDPSEIAKGMEAILPQYDNPETLAWLAAAGKAWGLQEFLELPEMKIGKVEEMPAFLGSARWTIKQPFERWGIRFSPRPDDPLRLFASLRYTTGMFEELLRREGFEPRQLAITACRQEALWCIRHD